MEMCLRVLKESNKSRFDRYGCQKQCIDHIPYCLSGLPCAHFSDNLSWNSCNCYVCQACQTSDQPPHCLKICWPFCSWSTQKAGFNKFADKHFQGLSREGKLGECTLILLLIFSLLARVSTNKDCIRHYSTCIFSLVSNAAVLCHHATRWHKKSCVGRLLPPCLSSCSRQILLLLHQTKPNSSH